MTDFGKIADPIADKALTGAALITLSVLGELPPADRDAVLGGTARVFYQLGEAE